MGVTIATMLPCSIFAPISFQVYLVILLGTQRMASIRCPSCLHIPPAGYYYRHPWKQEGGMIIDVILPLSLHYYNDKVGKAITRNADP
jgi:hypothetical protein